MFEKTTFALKSRDQRQKMLELRAGWPVELREAAGGGRLMRV